MEKKVFLLDAFALVFRAYYALIRSPRLTSKGKNTNAQFGFTNALIDLINKQKPSHLAVCFDTAAPTERHTDFADYKANRQEAPEDLLASIPDIKKIIEGLNIPIIETDGFEADDVIGYVATQLRQDGEKVIIMSSDKDFLQLVNKDVSVYSPTKKKVYNINEVVEEYGFHPHNFINFRMIDGDKSDNVEGIPGLGLKTIIKSFPLLTDEEVHTTESMLEFIKTQPKKTKAHELFENNLAILERNRKLMQLSEPEFSGNLRMKIIDRFEEPAPKFDKQGFLKVGLKTHILDSFPNVLDWLQSTFSHISKF
mgnify:CR=1 FL=1